MFHFQALSKNGKIFGSDIMVGVQPCIDKVSVKCIYHFLCLIILQSIIESSVTNSVTSTVPNKNLSTMRPLTAAYHASQSCNEVNVFFQYGNEFFLQVVPSNPNTPQKDNGFISKAMEYIFGW